MTVLNLVLIWC